MRRRNRTKEYPPGIDPAKLPRGCYWDNVRKHWYVTPRTESGPKRQKIAEQDAKLSDLHKIMEARAGEEIDTLIWLRKKFAASVQYTQLSAKTRTDYDYCASVVEAHPSKMSGLPIGKVPLSAWNAQASQKLIDQIAVANGPSAASHCYRYLRRLFNWSLTRGHIKVVPLGKVELPKERKQRRLPAHDALGRLIPFAQERGKLQAHTKGSCAPYIWKVLVIALRCRLRGIEILSMHEDQVLPRGLYCKRTKGSRDNVTLWSPDLKAAITSAIEERDAAWSALRKPIPMRPDDRLVIVGQKGERVTGSTWQSAWKRMIRMAIAAGVVTKEERFGLHDMKRRSITDTKGGRAAKLDGGGHVDERMLNTYDFEVPDSDAAGT
jgi:site-specific recombinase XerC